MAIKNNHAEGIAVTGWIACSVDQVEMEKAVKVTMLSHENFEKF